MKPLAKLWTWTGHLYLPIAIAWAVYVKNGLPGEVPHAGVLISRAYWGLLVSLVAGALLIWTWAQYAYLARKSPAEPLIPPDTTFEDLTDRSLLISWGGALVVFVGLISFTALFAIAYGDSRIYKWNESTPLSSGFFESRALAHNLSCTSPPCYAMGPRVDAGVPPYTGVNEYTLYFTDGALRMLGALTLIGILRLLVVLMGKRHIPANESV